MAENDPPDRIHFGSIDYQPNPAVLEFHGFNVVSSYFMPPLVFWRRPHPPWSLD
jgi:hypothetical protein